MFLQRCADEEDEGGSVESRARGAGGGVDARWQTRLRGGERDLADGDVVDRPHRGVVVTGEGGCSRAETGDDGEHCVCCEPEQCFTQKDAQKTVLEFAHLLSNKNFEKPEQCFTQKDAQKTGPWEKFGKGGASS